MRKAMIFRKENVVFKIWERMRITPPGSFRKRKLIKMKKTWMNIKSISFGSDLDICTRKSLA
jgi:hypothetical protein